MHSSCYQLGRLPQIAGPRRDVLSQRPPPLDDKLATASICHPFLQCDRQMLGYFDMIFEDISALAQELTT